MSMPQINPDVNLRKRKEHPSPLPTKNKQKAKKTDSSSLSECVGFDSKRNTVSDKQKAQDDRSEGKQEIDERYFCANRETSLVQSVNTNWLNDERVNYCIGKLVDGNVPRSTSSSAPVKIIYPLEFNLALTYLARGCIHENVYDQSSGNYIICAINTVNHWVLLCFNKLHHYCVYADPLGTPMGQEIRNTVRNAYPEYEIVDLEARVQFDGENCGVWVAVIASRFLKFCFSNPQGNPRTDFNLQNNSYGYSCVRNHARCEYEHVKIMNNEYIMRTRRMLMDSYNTEVRNRKELMEISKLHDMKDVI